MSTIGYCVIRPMRGASSQAFDGKREARIRATLARPSQ